MPETDTQHLMFNVRFINVVCKTIRYDRRV